MVLKWFETLYWNLVIIRRIRRKLRKGHWKEICEPCYERHIPNTVTPTYVVQEVLDYSPQIGNCDVCDRLHFLVYVIANYEELLPVKKECEKCQEETDHLLFYKKTDCWQECQQCNFTLKYKEKEEK